jgi:hypothetical protein
MLPKPEEPDGEEHGAVAGERGAGQRKDDQVRTFLSKMMRLIEEERRNRGIPQTTLAQTALAEPKPYSLSISYERWRTGQKMPSPEKVQAMIRHLGVKLPQEDDTTLQGLVLALELLERHPQALTLWTPNLKRRGRAWLKRWVDAGLLEEWRAWKGDRYRIHRD